MIDVKDVVNHEKKGKREGWAETGPTCWKQFIQWLWPKNRVLEKVPLMDRAAAGAGLEDATGVTERALAELATDSLCSRWRTLSTSCSTDLGASVAAAAGSLSGRDTIGGWSSRATTTGGLGWGWLNREKWDSRESVATVSSRT